MSRYSAPMLTRRGFLASAAASATGAMFPISPALPGTAATREISLRAAPGRVRLVPLAETAAWLYNGTVPGQEIRLRQGERLRVAVDNALAEETTIHWHGVRVPNAMDGVPHLTQKPIGAGERFLYEFDAVDAGTFWYHPHQRSFEQVGRGLYGPLIVEEPEPIRVDRDFTWVLGDWRLTKSGAISEDFGNRHDIHHSGRVGNTVTINGRVPDGFTVRKGERIRLRLINAANARIFSLDFAGHEPIVIALDGQPVTPHAPDKGLVVLGPAMRVDLIIDMTGNPGSRASVTDRFYKGLEYQLIDLVYDGTPLRERAPDWPLALPANPLPEPDVGAASRNEVVFNGGMMGEMVAQDMGKSMGLGTPGSMMDNTNSMMGGMMRMMNSSTAWFINGVAADEASHDMKPMLTFEKDKSHIIAMTNATAWHHPIHLHGHSFRVISRNGKPTHHREWQDTVLISPREKVEIAFVADNPGNWMFHCHILEHQASGMMAVFRVA
ncbi:copper oxidase [Phyllobacterium brassicacearum]|uniref:Copper oxidase n=1 Tax=Phyllobacterium brassicacearum TaxID=314235 RepID=A0A2P7BA02_9HYPH|nr:multicopper oxidase family protein [Phyllobacterium brassicacearum]PSH63304.1 copper oxidase [Phyllobacterium brassicacearum]TDQ18141.1 FtsP/CotA-like multicopper oxidase with cupredoxin domain [Phyllobacterium brassicacearum]